jgi:hypothetical protein
MPCEFFEHNPLHVESGRRDHIHRCKHPANVTRRCGYNNNNAESCPLYSDASLYCHYADCEFFEGDSRIMFTCSRCNNPSNFTRVCVRQGGIIAKFCPRLEKDEDD